METRANFALIGAFTLAIALAAFGFVYWFSGPSQLGAQQTYRIVFSGTVSGLSKGSPVLFNGLKVGEVTRLEISQSDPSKVDVLAAIDHRTPVKVDTRARLDQRGFTGVADVLLVGGTMNAPALQAQEGQDYPEIQAQRSEMQNLLGNAHELSAKAGELLIKLNKLLDDNAGSLGATIKNAEVFTKTLADNSQHVASILHDTAEFTHGLKALDQKKLTQITNDLASALANLNKFSSVGLKQYEGLEIDGRTAIHTLDRTLRSIERDPSQFIFGPSQQQAPQLAPPESRTEDDQKSAPPLKSKSKSR
ncbi:MAG: MlaD family protein [Methylocystis sp.]